MREFELIDELAARIREAGVAGGERVVVGTGDDAAVTTPGGASVTSVDMAVEGVHFRRETSSLEQIGRKALATALSDLAAMGARPGEAFVALGVPEDLDREGSRALLDGLVEIAAETGTAIAGGDVAAAPALTLAVSVVGHVDSAEHAVGRDGAADGQVICVTGELGAAAAGLLLTERPELRDALDPEIAAALLRRQHDPRPRLEAGVALAASGAAAMIDVSDGLGADAGHIARASDAYLTIELGRLPVTAGVAEVAEAADMGLDALDLAAAGGEDYELLATIGADRLDAAAAAVLETGTQLSAIGEVTRGCGVELRATDGSARPPRGFEHRRGTR
jgi:thiamine-monophosphate kinase